jgi:hypothetical protein
MDPFIESQHWQDSHTRLIVACSDQLVPRVRPNYFVQVEKHVYVVDDEELTGDMIPDVSVGRSLYERPVDEGGGTAVAIRPRTHRIPLPMTVRQSYLTIRSREGREIVTVIELLSPWNKAPREGAGEYLSKRLEVLRSSANLVEIDLLRGGRRLPTEEPLGPFDYHAFVSRPDRRPEVDVYSWRLADRLPTIPIPLAGSDPDVPLELQELLSTIYDRGGYEDVLNYRAAIDPPLPPDGEQWLAQRLQGVQPR